MKLIGINGGTFDPIHYGHLRPALDVQIRLGLQQVRFVPCFQPVHRATPSVSAEHRKAMIQLAIAGQATFCLDSIEIDQGGPSYMVNTLRTLKQQFAEESLVLMMGTDAFAKFHTWFDWQGILALANIAVMHRPGEPIPLDGESGIIFKTFAVEQLSQLAGQIVEVAVTQLDLSATTLRQYLKQGVPVDYLLPPEVIAYIKAHRLYQS